MYMNIMDLDKEREIKALIDKLGKVISVNPETVKRTSEVLKGNLLMSDTDKTRTVSVRFPIELLEWIDSYSRIAAVNCESRVTRNATVIGFLETMKSVIEYREKTEWGMSHQDMIKQVIESAKQNPGV